MKSPVLIMLILMLAGGCGGCGDDPEKDRSDSGGDASDAAGDPSDAGGIDGGDEVGVDGSAPRCEPLVRGCRGACSTADPTLNACGACGDECVAGLGCAAGLCRAPCATFDATRAIPVSGPTFARGDVDGDGDDDFVSANWSLIAATLQDGEVTDVTTSPSTLAAQWVHVGDFDGDGDGDVLAVADNEWSYHENTGGAWTSTAPEGAFFNASAVADMTGDGRVEWLSVTSSATEVFFGDPANPDTRRNTITSYASAGVFAELDGAVPMEVVLQESDQVVRVYRYDGISFQLKSEVPLDTEATALQAGDLDGDGLVDLVAATSRGTRVLWGSGPSEFAPPTAPALDSRARNIGDLDGDGTAELYAAVGSTITQERWDGVQFVTRYFRGRPSEGTPQVADVDGDGDNEILVPQERGLAVIETLVETPAPVTMQEATAADLDADGDLDVVLRAGFGDRLCWLRNEGGTLGHFSCSAATPRGFAVADLTGDQRADVIVADETIDLLVTDADGLSTTPLTLRSDAGANAVSIARGGAEPRLVVSEFDDRLTVYPITPTALGTPVLEADTGNFGRIWVGDVDGDGIDDIITQSGDDGSSLYRGAAASFSAAEPFTEQIAPVVASGDIDGDGTLDILTREEVLWGPTFADATRFLPQSLTAVAVAAIDSDAALEVVAGNADQTVVVGFGADRVPEASRAYGAPGPVALADIDGDGVLDLISVTGALTVTRGVSGGFDAPPFAQTGGDVPAEAFAADLDGDGRHELAVGHLNAGLTVSRRDADGVWTPTLVADATQPLSATPADFDQDGYTELLVTGSNVGGLAYDAASYFVEAEGDGFLTTELPGTGYRAVVGRFDDDAYPDYALLSRIVGDRAIYIQDEEQGWVQGDELSQHLGLVGGDFDGDGRVELLQFADTNTFGWLLFDVGTDGALSEPVALDFVETSPAIAADVNGDGLDDVIGIEGAATDAATIRIYWGTDGIGIDPANFAKVALGHPVTSVETASLDDRDGLELIMTTADISTIVGWDGAAPTRLGTYAEGRIGGAGDFDADGRFELVQLRAHGVRLIDSTCSN